MKSGISRRPVPVDRSLYNKVKASVYRKMPNHSAYRSGHLVKAYKMAFAKKYGSLKNPYQGVSGNKKGESGLSRWFKEKWRNQRGDVGYSRVGDVYRPTVRVNSKTPKTFGELSQIEIKKAMKLKRQKGRAKF